MSEPRPAFELVVCGAATCPEWFVAQTLDRLTERVQSTHLLTVTTRGDADGEAVGNWSRRQAWARVVCYLEPVLPGVYGRFAEPRWAMKVVSTASAIVIFGPDRRWWRVVRYAKDAGVDVRLYPVPATLPGPSSPALPDLPPDPVHSAG